MMPCRRAQPSSTASGTTPFGGREWSEQCTYSLFLLAGAYGGYISSNSSLQRPGYAGRCAPTFHRAAFLAAMAAIGHERSAVAIPEGCHSEAASIRHRHSPDTDERPRPNANGTP